MNNNNATPFFDTAVTNVLKGVAILIMFFHHFLTFPDWWPEGVDYPIMRQIADALWSPMQICVGIFCFLTGYFYYFNKNKTLRYSIKKDTSFMISYWAVMFILVPIALAVCDFNPYTPYVFFKELLGHNAPTMIFCWYVFFYYNAMLIMPFITKILGKHPIRDCVICLFFVSFFAEYFEYLTWKIMLQEVYRSMLWLPVMLLGYLFANYGWFEQFKAFNDRLIKNKFLNVILWIVFGVLACAYRNFQPTMMIHFLQYTFSAKEPIVNIKMDVFYAPVVVYCLIRLHEVIRCKWSDKILIAIGKKSMLMWFFSCLFFSFARLQIAPFLYLPKTSLGVMIWGTFLCYIPSCLLQPLVNRLSKYSDRGWDWIFGKIDTLPFMKKAV